MKKLFYLIALLPFAFACGNGENEGGLSTEDSLTAVAEGRKVRISVQDSSIQSFIEGYNAIQESLDSIKDKEKMILGNSKDPETRKSKEEQIVADIQAMYDIMNRNKQQISNLQAKLKKSNNKNAELEKFIARLTTEIEEKDAQINNLKSELEKLNVELANLNINYQEVSAESEVKTQKLKTAYYTFGTKKELTKNNVLTKESGFIGLGKASKMKNDFNKEYFTKVDISNFSTITLGAKSAKLVTTHPANSYKIEGKDGKAEKLVITNSQDFWSVSKYLVIIVD